MSGVLLFAAIYMVVNGWGLLQDVLDRALMAIGHVLEQGLQEPLGRGELILDAC